MFIAAQPEGHLCLFEHCPIRHEEEGVKEWVDIEWQDTGHAVGMLCVLPGYIHPGMSYEDDQIEVHFAYPKNHADRTSDIIKSSSRSTDKEAFRHGAQWADSHKFYNVNVITPL